jgi:amino acid adenylation domain-containing protein
MVATRMKTIISKFEQYAALTPKAMAIKHEDKCWTYEELNNYANSIAYYLIELGIEESSVVAVYGEKSFEMIAAMLAILKLRCSYMPIDTSLPLSRIETMLNNANSGFLISHGVDLKDLKLRSITCIDVNYSTFDKSKHFNNIGRTIHCNDAAYIMHTSGSTGTPKGVIIPHRGVIRLLNNTNYLKVNHLDKVLFHSNTSFDAAIFEVWAALLNGACLVISKHLTGDVPAIFKLCQQQEITILLLATGLFHIFSTLELNELPSLRYLVVGGDVMHSSAAQRAMQKHSRLTLINGYGPAENAVFTTCLVINNENDVTSPVSIGKPITGTQVYLLDEAFNPVKQGEIGELYTGGEGLALGYINAPVLTAEKFVNLPHISANGLLYRTGDLARMLPNGNIEFIGRRDNQVKIRGFRVELTEIETAISALNFVEDVCVCVIEGQNKKIAAFIKTQQSLATNDIEYKSKILAYLKEKLPVYCIPSLIEINSDFPLTINGKIDRRCLQERLQRYSVVNVS